MWSLYVRLRKKTNFNHTVFFGVVEDGGGGGVWTRKTLGGGANFVWVIQTRLGGGLLVTAFQHGRVLTEPLTQHIVIKILLLTHF